MPLPNDILVRGKALGLDIEAIAGQDPAEVAAYLSEVEKAAAEADDGDPEPEAEGGDATVKSLIALLGKAFAALTPGTSGKVRKDDAGDDDEESDDEKPSSDPEVLALRKELDEQKKEHEAERTELRVEKAETLLEAAVKDKRMTPATAKALTPIVKHLAESQVEHVEKSDKGKETTTSMVELVVKAASQDREVLATLFETAGAAAKAKGEADGPALWEHIKEKQKTTAGNGDAANN